MTHDQLLAFVTAVSEGTFSGASKVLHKTQPAVSKLIANLEAELGLTLFDRTSYRPVLTDAGQRFHARALAVVSQTEALRGFGLQLAGTPEPELRLVLEAITPLSAIVPELQRVRARFPAVRYSLRTEHLGGVLEALREGSVDLAVATTHPLDHRLLDTQRLYEVRIIPVVHAEHPLATAGSPAPPDLLREHPQVVLRDSGPQTSARDVNLLPGGRRWSVTDVWAKRELIVAGMGWGGLPLHVVAPDLERGTLVALDVREFEVDVIPLSLLRRRDRAHGPVAQDLWQALSAGS